MVVICVCQDYNLRFLLSQLLNDIESDIVLVCWQVSIVGYLSEWRYKKQPRAVPKFKKLLLDF